MSCSANVSEPGWWADAFASLTPADRQALTAWLRHTEGFDGIEDFSGRPWFDDWPGTILGVFEGGRSRASWLLIRHADRWIAAHCADGFVSAPADSLQAVLSFIA